MSGLYRDGFRLRLYPAGGHVTEEQVMVEYFSTTRWDGAVDLSWYNGTDTEFTPDHSGTAGGCGRAGEQQYHRLRRQDHPPGGGYLPAAV